MIQKRHPVNSDRVEQREYDNRTRIGKKRNICERTKACVLEPLPSTDLISHILLLNNMEKLAISG